MEAHNSSQRQWRNEPVALIGSSCRFAGCNSPAEFWDLLRQPRDVLSAIPGDRFSTDGFFHSQSQYHGHANVSSAYLLAEDVRRFDASFFGIKPVEASATDPQQRLLLEVVYEAIEAAGIPITGLRGSNTAIYVGLMCGDYDTMISRDTDAIPTYHATGTARSIISNRVSYFFDWRGPSMTIDTACSSSLVALHQAVQSLRAGETPMAVVAGSNLILGPEQFIAESKLKMLSPEGRSRMWDAGADGYARGEGVAAVVLKPLSAALRDNDDIECLIIETGINQDGHTSGITVPSAAAQAELIRDTYHKAGLDPRKATDRCQYFEAHGTGTPVGDPIEAKAIHTAFFDDEQEAKLRLLVGSVKTIVGHTEGTAGLAGVMKAALALQNSIVPANMLFNELNPSIKPYTGSLELSTQAKDWPTRAFNSPRRASVNSFGFGGANAHAILESYEPVTTGKLPPVSEPPQCFIPFVFSTHSTSSLQALLRTYAEFLRSHPSISLRNLAFTLYSRRSHWPCKAAFAASSVQGLVDQLDDFLQKKSSPDSITRTRPNQLPSSPRILGVFTGQGAQWAGMGAGLLERSTFARSCVSRFDEWLAELPVKHRPTWTVLVELSKPELDSRINESELSQPLCTAIQVVLVKILRNSGADFHAVVGHSSGEIAAAYAAGFITEKEAIYIAYYRGFFSHLAQGSQGHQGRMIACGTSLEDAQELCDLPYFRGRMNIAARNSSSSFTLSGDRDRIEQAIRVFQDEKKFVRLLKVDKAYHSSHMVRCAGPYANALAETEGLLSGAENNDRSLNQAIQWYSSVTAERMNHHASVGTDYWIQNMVKPVLFHEAIATACTEEGGFDLAVEIGPHPALQAVASQTLQDSCTNPVPYTGLLKRGTDDAEAIALGLGSLWRHFPDSFDLTVTDRLLSGTEGFQLIKNLPTFCWDHDKVYWHESRQSKAVRSRDPVHQLLGHLTPDSTPQLYRWRHILSVSEIPWLEGHQLQGQIVFPAAGYVVTALEAALTLSKHQHPTAVELQELDILHAMTFDESVKNVEVLFTISDICHTDGHSTSARFMYEAALGNSEDGFSLLAKGKLVVSTGGLDIPPAPSRSAPEPYTVDIDSEQFYTSLLNVGYGYTGPFKALNGLQRKMGWVTGFVSLNKGGEDLSDDLVIHPGTLDAAIQAVILAHSYPEDGTLWSLHIPRSIQRITLDLASLGAGYTRTMSLPFDAISSNENENALSGDVELFDPMTERCLVRLEGIRCTPFSPATGADDRSLFSYEDWSPALPDAVYASTGRNATQEQYDVAMALERVAFFFMGHILKNVSLDHPARSTEPYTRMFAYMHDVRSETPNEEHPYIEADWRNDTYAEIVPLMEKYRDTTDMQIMRTVGEQMVHVIHGETTILEHLMREDLLYRHYSEGMGFADHSAFFARTVAQITRRYPHMNMLEVGAGTGAATRDVFHETGAKFDRYVFTDVSTGFFDSAKVLFKDNASRMLFKTLDVELDVVQQGFEPYSFDLIIASNVIHATKSISNSLYNIRKLLKPGGYLAVLEITSNAPIRNGFIFGSLPGWWLGASDGRVKSPCISPEKWDQLFRLSGFSGVDTITPQTHTLPYPGSGFITQAIDEKIDFLRTPSSQVAHSLAIGPIADRLILIGGLSEASRDLGERLRTELEPFFGQVIFSSSTANINSLESVPRTAVLSITDLERPFWEDITPEKFNGFKSIFDTVDIVLWVTKGRQAENPYSNMSVGFGRSQLLESPNVHHRFLDFQDTDATADKIVAGFLRFGAEFHWKRHLETKYLWSIEHEIEVAKSGEQILRLVGSEKLNRRYNSARRPIFSPQDSEKCSITLSQDDSSYCLERSHRQQDDPESGCADLLATNTMYSSLSAVHFGSDGAFFVGYGTHDQKSIVYLFDTLSSTPRVPALSMMPCRIASSRIPDYLFYCMCSLVALNIFGDWSAASSGTVLILDAPEPIGQIMARRAVERSAKIRFFTSSSQQSSLSPITIHSQTPRRMIQKFVARDTCAFVDFTATEQGRKVSALIQGMVPSHCRYEKIASIGTKKASIKTPSNTVRSLFAQATKLAEGDVAEDFSYGHVLPLSLDALTMNDVHGQPFSIVRWDSLDRLSVRIRPVDTMAWYRPDRTYWLVGLTQSLGLSLCEWMMSKGARNFVLSSRSPKVDQRWLKKTQEQGATVKIFANDVCDMESLQSLRLTISQTMPPIAGIAQGAMVLRDGLAKGMSLEDFLTVSNPKVVGSRNLDAIFQHDKLDFFIFFSSMATIVGNLGQCNYTAANAYITSLAAQRRKRGVAASVINIGAILGVGYVTQQLDATLQTKLKDGGHTWMSEQDLRQMFAEGILASDPTYDGPSQISAGLRYISKTDPVKPHWYDDPVFSHQILHEDSTTTSAAVDSKSNLPLKTQISQASSRDEIVQLVREHFVAKLKSALQIVENADLNDMDILNKSMDSLGIDSLIAVDLRTWFMRGLGVNIPVLKILGGIYVMDLIKFAADLVCTDLTADHKDEREQSQVATSPLITDEVTTSSAQSESSDMDATSSSTTKTSRNGSSENSVHEFSKRNSTSATEARKDASSGLSDDYSMTGLPLSHAQSMFWFAAIYTDNRASLNHSGVYRIDGDLRVHDFQRAVDLVTKRHDILRTCIVYTEGANPTQTVLKVPNLKLEIETINEREKVWTHLRNLQTGAFDLSNGPAMRLMLLRHSSCEHYLVMACHPVILDGTSHQVFMADLELAYENQPLPSVRQFGQHAKLERSNNSHSDLWAADMKYWTEEFSTLPVPLNLFPLAKGKYRATLRTHAVCRVDKRIETGLNSQIRRFCSRQRVTPFQYHFAVFRTLLYSLTLQEDICVGMADANRTHTDMLDVSAIGPYVNLLPIRFTHKSQTTFAELLNDTKSQVVAGLAHSRLPFEVLLNALKLVRSSSHTPLFQSFIDYRQGAREKQPFGNCNIEVLNFDAGTNGYDVSLDLIDNPSGDCLVMLMTQESLYGRHEAELLASSYVHLLKQCMNNPESSLDTIDVYPPKARQAALHLSIGRSQEPEWPPTLVHRVDDVIAALPDSIALEDGMGTSLTYASFDLRIRSISAELLSLGVREGDAVGTYQQPTADYICSLFAIIRLGAIYVPLDTAFPLARLTSMASESRIVALLSTKSEIGKAHEICVQLPKEVTFINLSKISNSTTPIPIRATPTAPAVILYTSGSTSTPKGVVLSHSNLRNDIEMSAEPYKVQQEVVLQQSSFGFDMSLTQVFLALAYGGSLLVAPESARRDPVAISSIIRQENVSLTVATPSEYSHWLTVGGHEKLQKSSWKTAISGGEEILPRLVDQFRRMHKADLTLFNAYGPTETTCCVTRLKVSLDDFLETGVPAGRPVNNAATYVLDEQFRPVPVGVAGEIFIGGAGVSLGYLNDAENTQRFLRNPYSNPEFESKQWNRMYRTGDVGRWLYDGNLHLGGRIADDTQIKLRGLRIDLREIEASILTVAKGRIAEVIVASRTPDGGAPSFLAAYVVLTSEIETQAMERLWSTIRSNLPLPQYMHPAVVIRVSSIPRTPSNKVDRKALSALELVHLPDTLDSDLTGVDTQLCHIWREVLTPIPVGPLGPETDFFMIGGNSMLLIALQARIRSEYGVDVALYRLFEHSTVRSMSSIISAEPNTQYKVYDWEQESAILQQDQELAVPPYADPMVTDSLVVVLTGATGYLGQALLRRILVHPLLVMVHCLAVRQPDALGELLQHPKVAVHPGNLEDVNFGLRPLELSEIFQSATVAIHNGADVSHLQPYASLKNANLESTKRLFELCLPRRTPLHFISTAGVALTSGLEEFSEASAAAFTPLVDGSDGYTATKWCSERFLEKSCAHYDIPTWIHRPSSIFRHTEPGQDILQNLLNYIKLTKLVPQMGFLEGYFDVVYLTTVVEGIVQCLGADMAQGTAYRHHSGDLQVPFGGLKKFLEDSERVQLEERDIDEWIERAEEAGMSPLIAAVLQKMANSGRKVLFPKLVKGAY